MVHRHVLVAAFLATLAVQPSFADVAGPATVVDGDTIVVAGERVRLERAGEAEARRAGAGIWRSEFTPSWEWRAARR